MLVGAWPMARTIVWSHPLARGQVRIGSLPLPGTPLRAPCLSLVSQPGTPSRREQGREACRAHQRPRVSGASQVRRWQGRDGPGGAGVRSIAGVPCRSNRKESHDCKRLRCVAGGHRFKDFRAQDQARPQAGSPRVAHPKGLRDGQPTPPTPRASRSPVAHTQIAHASRTTLIATAHATAHGHAGRRAPEGRSEPRNGEVERRRSRRHRKAAPSKVKGRPGVPLAV